MLEEEPKLDAHVRRMERMGFCDALLRCSWRIACRHCSNYIFILNLTPGFNGLSEDNCTRIQETFKLWDLVWLILEVLRYLQNSKDTQWVLLHIKRAEGIVQVAGIFRKLFRAFGDEFTQLAEIACKGRRKNFHRIMITQCSPVVTHLIFSKKSSQ